VLDTFYIPTCYPNSHAERAPFEHCGPLQGKEALRYARRGHAPFTVFSGLREPPEDAPSLFPVELLDLSQAEPAFRERVWGCCGANPRAPHRRPQGAPYLAA